jgi:hypothetical protein
MGSDEDGWDGIIPLFVVFGWETTLGVRDERLRNLGQAYSLKNHEWVHPSLLVSLMVIYEDVIISIIPSIKHKRWWVYPSFLSFESNTMWDEFILDIRNDPVPYLLMLNKV